MYLAELKGKIPSKLEGKEDLLTSNVFSFFKYSTRTIYLNKFLQILGCECSDRDLEDAEFGFWPTYEDHTEPDLVIIVGKHYILIEAKLYSGFGQESDTQKAQIDREVSGGQQEAKSLDKKFHLIALTNHYHYPANEFRYLKSDIRAYVKWLNWQKIAEMLLDFLESDNPELPDRQFAQDCYDLLDKKKLRSFLPFTRLAGEVQPVPESIFFSAKVASFRGAFLGFGPALDLLPVLPKPSTRLFFRPKKFFARLQNINIENVDFKLGGNR